MIHKKAGLFSSKPATLVNRDRHLTGINTRNPVDTGRVARMSGSQGVPHTSVLRVGLLTAFESCGVRSSVSDSYDLLPWASGPEIASPSFSARGGAPHVGFTCGAFDSAFEFPDVHSSIRKIDRYQPYLTSFIRYETAPGPFTRASYEPPFHRISVHVLDLLSNLLRAIHIEIVKSRLPEPWQFRLTLLKCQPHLSRRHMTFLPS
jgi:hypothetical protein